MEASPQRLDLYLEVSLGSRRNEEAILLGPPPYKHTKAPSPVCCILAVDSDVLDPPPHSLSLSKYIYICKTTGAERRENFFYKKILLLFLALH